MSEPERAATGMRSRGLALGFLGLMGVVIVGYFVLGMPGMDHGSSGGTGGMPGMVMSLDVDEFAERNGATDAFVVNVHVPADSSITGTDAVIRYDELLGDARLPSDKNTPISLYCRTGAMSGVAAEALMRAGYTDVVHLAGGTDAWLRSGRALG